MIPRIAAIALVTLALAACPDGGADQQATASPFPPCRARGLLSVGESLPDCTFEGVAGAPPVSLASLRGKPLVINFWASWCANCIIEMPAFERVANRFDGRVHFVGMNFLGGTQRETRAAAERFAKSTGVTYPMAYDPDGLFYGHFQNRSRALLPITVFVDARGVVRASHFGGPVLDEELVSLISEHLGVS